jgi:hypothetical protein
MRAVVLTTVFILCGARAARAESWPSEMQLSGIFSIPGQSPLTFSGEVHALAGTTFFAVDFGLGYQSWIVPDRVREDIVKRVIQASASLQFRPLLALPAGKWINPFLSFGIEPGVEWTHSAQFRVEGFFGVGIDVRMATTNPHPFLNFQFRHSPEDNLAKAESAYFFGAGIRWYEI